MDARRLIELSQPTYGNDDDGTIVDEAYFRGQLDMYNAINAALASGDKQRIVFLKANAERKLAEIEEFWELQG